MFIASTQGQVHARIRAPEENRIYSIEFDQETGEHRLLELDPIKAEPPLVENLAAMVPPPITDAPDPSKAEIELELNGDDLAIADEQAAYETANPEALANADAHGAPAGSAPSAAGSPVAAAAPGDQIVDIMVVYTNTVLSAAGSKANVDNRIALGLAYCQRNLRQQHQRHAGSSGSLLPNNVRIELLQYSQLLSTITQSTANDGAFAWTVPTTLDGSGFAIRISNQDRTATDISDATFRIASGGGGGGVDTRYEAEYASLYSAAHRTRYSGFSGAGYADYIGRGSGAYVDENGAPVHGAYVYGNFTGDRPMSWMANTDTTGTATLVTGWGYGINNLSFCVTDIWHPYDPYVSVENVETCDSL